MAWNTPRTWVAAELVSAALLNTHVRDNENALRDFALGAQDLAANWKISSGRTLQFQETGVGHGMTSLMPTDNWFQIAENTAGAGGAVLTGARDTDQLGLTLHGVNGSPTPTVAGLAIQASKRSGTTTQSFAASEIAMQFYNGGTVIGNWYGSGHLGVVGSLNCSGAARIGFSGTPTNLLEIGDAAWNFSSAGGVFPTITFDTNDYMYYDRAGNSFLFHPGNTSALELTATEVRAVVILRTLDPLVNLGGGAAPTLGTIGGSGPATAAQNKWFRMRDAAGADFWVPVWK